MGMEGHEEAASIEITHDKDQTTTVSTSTSPPSPLQTRLPDSSPATDTADEGPLPSNLVPDSVVVPDVSASVDDSNNTVALPAGVDPVEIEAQVKHGAEEGAERTGEGEVDVFLAGAGVETPNSLGFAPISPGLSSIALPLGLAPQAPKTGSIGASSEQTTAAEETPAAEAKVGDLVEMTFGRGQVRHVREDGMLEVEAMGWEMANENRARFILRKDAVKVVPTVYYKMPVLERLQISAWLKEEGTRLFKEGDITGAVERYMKAIGVIKTCDFKTNAHNARALEVMIPCHNNAATCNIKLKNYKDARLLAENVDTLCTALERNRGGLVMTALKARGVQEIKVLGHWWCKGLFLGGKACLYQGDNDEAVTCLKKASKIARPPALAKSRSDIMTQLELAVKRSTNQKAKAKKMWNKAFKKNSTESAPEPPSQARGLPLLGVTPKFDALQKLEQLAQMGNVAKEMPGQGKQDAHEDESDSAYDDEEEATASHGWWTSTAVAVGLVVAAVCVGRVLSKRR